MDRLCFLLGFRASLVSIAVFFFGASLRADEKWEAWWGYNRAPVLELKAKIHQPQITVGSDYSLGDPDPENRDEFITPERIQIINRVIPALRRALKDDFFGVRGTAAVALAKAGEPKELSAILPLVWDEHKKVRESAVIALGALANPKAIEPLVGIMRDDRRGRRLVRRTEILMRTRSFAAVSLGLIGRYHKPSRPKVLDSLRRSFDYDQSPQDLPLLILVALGLMEDPRAVEFLQGVVKQQLCPDFLRAHAVASLGKIGNRTALPLVQRALKDKSGAVVRSAIQALGALAPEKDEKSVRLLANFAVLGRESQGRAWAILALGKIGGKEAHRVLRHILEQDQDWRKAWAALGLALLAKKTGDTSDADLIYRMFREMKGVSVRSAFASALGMMGYRQARFDLLDLAIAKGDPGLKGYCAVALGLMHATDTLPALKRSLGSRIDPGFLTSVAEALGLMSDPEVVPILLENLRSAETTYHISTIVQSLGFIADQTAIDPLIRILQDPEMSNGNRISAASALGVLAESRLLPSYHVISVDADYSAILGSYRILLGMQ